MTEGFNREDEHVTFKEAATRLQIGLISVEALIRAGRITANNDRMIAASDIERLLELQRDPPTMAEYKPMKGSRQRHRMGLYFVGIAPYIKIGVATDVAWRWGVMPVERLGFIPIPDKTSMFAKERELHALFDAYRWRGEWFHENILLAQYIGQHAEPWPEARP